MLQQRSPPPQIDGTQGKMARIGKILSTIGLGLRPARPEMGNVCQTARLPPRFGPTAGRNARRRCPDEILTTRVQPIDRGLFVDSDLAVCVFKVACGTLTYRQRAKGRSQSLLWTCCAATRRDRPVRYLGRFRHQAADECRWLRALDMRPKAAVAQDVLGFHGVIGLIRLV